MVTQDQKRRLLQLTIEAVNAIMCNYDDLISILLSFFVITDGMYREINSHPNKATRAMELHLLIMRRDRGAYERYYRALHQVGEYDLAKQMEDLLDPRYGTPLPRPPMVMPSVTQVQTQEPLYRLLKKNTLWSWGPQQDHAVTSLTEALATDDVLVHYDPQLPLGMSCDASDVGVGAVLFHSIMNLQL